MDECAFRLIFIYFYLNSRVPLLEVNESIIFQFLNTFQFPKLREGLLQQFLCDRSGEFTNKQHLDLIENAKHCENLL